MTDGSSRCDFSEVSVRITTEDGSQKYTHKSISYAPIKATHDCKELSEIVEEAKAAFKGSADEITVTIKYQW